MPYQQTNDDRWWVDVESSSEFKTPVLLDFLEEIPCYHLKGGKIKARKLTEPEEERVLVELQKRKKAAKKERQKELAEIWESQERAAASVSVLYPTSYEDK